MKFRKWSMNLEEIVLFRQTGVLQKYGYTVLWRNRMHFGLLDPWSARLQAMCSFFWSHQIESVVIISSCGYGLFQISCRKQSPFYEPLIVLQRWCNYYPSMEFCLYIGGGKLRAISQRDTSVFYPFLVEKRDELASLLKAFVNEIVLPYFSVDQCTLVRMIWT